MGSIAIHIIINAFKVRITSMGILGILNIWILLTKIVINLVRRKCHFFAVKVDRSDVIAGICKEVSI